MKEQVISFETAKLAKEKGFDNDSDGYYGMMNGHFKCVDGQETCDAPTQSLLQKWLREVHSLSVKIDDYITNSRVRYDYSVSDLGSQEDNPIGVFETYEEALEQGLQEALSLIK